MAPQAVAVGFGNIEHAAQPVAELGDEPLTAHRFCHVDSVLGIVALAVPPACGVTVEVESTDELLGEVWSEDDITAEAVVATNRHVVVKQEWVTLCFSVPCYSAKRHDGGSGLKTRSLQIEGNVNGSHVYRNLR